MESYYNIGLRSFREGIIASDEQVTIYVGPSQVKFMLSMQVLFPRCDFFKFAFGGIWTETQTGVMYLPEDDPRAFQYFVDWVTDNAVTPPPFDAGAEELRQLVGAFILADKLCIVDFQNKVMDALQTVALKNELHVVRLAEHIYSNTMEGSTLRLFVTALFEQSLRNRGSQKLYTDYSEAYYKSNGPYEPYVQDLSLQDREDDFCDFQERWMTKGRNVCIPHLIGGRQHGFHPCFFHSHAEGETCYRGEPFAKINGMLSRQKHNEFMASLCSKKDNFQTVIITTLKE